MHLRAAALRYWSKMTRLWVGHFKTISGRFLANYIHSFHKTEALTVILKCLTYSNLNWIKSYDTNHIFFASSFSQFCKNFFWKFMTHKWSFYDHFLPFFCHRYDYFLTTVWSSNNCLMTTSDDCLKIARNYLKPAVSTAKGFQATSQ